jgi:hypothetical protein
MHRKRKLARKTSKQLKRKLKSIQRHNEHIHIAVAEIAARV